MTPDILTEIDELIAAFFSVFDNRIHQIPDFSRLEQMFLPEAIITKCDGDQRETMSLQTFIAPRKLLFTSGSLQDFHEWETEAHTFIHGVTATRLSKYEKKGLLDGALYAGIGEKSIQLLRTAHGWRIVSVLWEDTES